MHPLFRALCLIICSGILPYLNKTADSDAVFSKVSPLAIFAGNKIGEKYHAIFSGKEARWTKIWTRGGAGGPKGVAPRGPCTWPHGPPKLGLGHRLASGLRRMPSYKRKTLALGGGESLCRIGGLTDAHG